MTCGALVCWSKYTTNVVHFQIIKLTLNSINGYEFSICSDFNHPIAENCLNMYKQSPTFYHPYSPWRNPGTSSRDPLAEHTHWKPTMYAFCVRRKINSLFLNLTLDNWVLKNDQNWILKWISFRSYLEFWPNLLTVAY